MVVVLLMSTSQMPMHLWVLPMLTAVCVVGVLSLQIENSDKFSSPLNLTNLDIVYIAYTEWNQQ